MSLFKRIGILSVVIMIQLLFISIAVNKMNPERMGDYFLHALPIVLFISAFSWEVITLASNTIEAAEEVDTSTSVAGGKQ